MLIKLNKFDPSEFIEAGLLKKMSGYLVHIKLKNGIQLDVGGELIIFTDLLGQFLVAKTVDIKGKFCIASILGTLKERDGVRKNVFVEKMLVRTRKNAQVWHKAETGG